MAKDHPNNPLQDRSRDHVQRFLPDGIAQFQKFAIEDHGDNFWRFQLPALQTEPQEAAGVFMIRIAPVILFATFACSPASADERISHGLQPPT
jgi:hypothetical protein